MFWILRRTGAANFFTSINNNYSSKSHTNNNNSYGKLSFFFLLLSTSNRKRDTKSESKWNNKTFRKQCNFNFRKLPTNFSLPRVHFGHGYDRDFNNKCCQCKTPTRFHVQTINQITLICLISMKFIICWAFFYLYDSMHSVAVANLNTSHHSM